MITAIFRMRFWNVICSYGFRVFMKLLSAFIIITFSLGCHAEALNKRDLTVYKVVKAQCSLSLSPLNYFRQLRFQLKTIGSGFKKGLWFDFSAGSIEEIKNNPGLNLALQECFGNDGETVKNIFLWPIQSNERFGQVAGATTLYLLTGKFAELIQWVSGSWISQNVALFLARVGVLGFVQNHGLNGIVAEQDKNLF
jgi:hypothetical protein